MSVLYSHNMGRIGFKNAGAHAFRGFKQIQGIAKRGHKFLQGTPQHLRTLDEYAGKGAHLLGKAGHMASAVGALFGNARLSHAGSKLAQGSESIQNVRQRGRQIANVATNIMGESMAHH